MRQVCHPLQRSAGFFARYLPAYSQNRDAMTKKKRQFKNSKELISFLGSITMVAILVFVHLVYFYYVFTNVVVFDVSNTNDILSPFSVHLYFSMFFIISSMVIFIMDGMIMFAYRPIGCM